MNFKQLTIVDNERLLIAVTERATEFVTLCFSGVGHAVGGVDIQGVEFAKSSGESTTIFIVDKKRSWGNAFEFNEIVEAIVKYTKNKIINVIGNSMGGFLAILACNFFNVSVCCVFVPQYSVSRKIIPQEDRYVRYTKYIHEWRYESLRDCFVDATRYYIFFAKDGGIEDLHRGLFPKKFNIAMFVFEDTSWAHVVAQKLKEKGCLYPLIHSCFSVLQPQVILDDYLKGFDVSLHISDL